MIGRVYYEHGEPVTVLVRWAGKGPRNVLIERADGTRVVRSFRGLRLPAPDFNPRVDYPERYMPDGVWSI